MARMVRAEVCAPDEVAVVHVMNRVVRRCYLLSDHPVISHFHQQMTIPPPPPPRPANRKRNAQIILLESRYQPRLATKRLLSRYR
jgi:hypothetical protein